MEQFLRHLKNQNVNKLDGFTGTFDDLNYAKDLRATGVTATEFDTLDGFTGTHEDLNYAKDLRATGVTTTEFDKLDGLTASTTELNYTDITTLGTVEASKAGTADSSGNINFNNGNMTNVDIDSGAIDGTNIGATSAGTGAFTTLTLGGTAITASGAELNFTDGVTSNIQKFEHCIYKYIYIYIFVLILTNI